jgi:hypothetical protein
MGDKTMHTLKEFKGSMIGETPFTHLDERPWQYLYTFGKYSRVPIRFVDWTIVGSSIRVVPSSGLSIPAQGGRDIGLSKKPVDRTSMA